jgi:NADH:ubiquinone oxidoreductase subunit 4 (subunit M)
MYTITMLNKVIFGNVKVSYFTRWKDITKKENFILMTLGITTLFFGVAPNFLLELSFPSISYLLFSIFYW